MARPPLSLRGQGLRIGLAIPALVGIFFLGQALLDARSWRLDLTPGRRYTLSGHARQVLGNLDRDVRVLAFLRSQDPRNPLIEDLLRQVRAAAPRVRVDSVDVNRNPALAREYDVDSYGALVVESEGRRRVFANPREETLVAAVLQVTRQQRKTVAWVTGHGEGDLTSGERNRGYATARIFLEQEYYEVVPISLLGDEVPVGTAALLVVGPQKDFLPDELAALDRYLQRPGNAVVLLDPQRAPGLANFLGQYRVALPDDVVVDPSARLYGGEYLTMQLGYDRRAHPIVGPMEAPPLFSLTRSVDRIAEEIPGTWFTSLLSTGQDSWATTDLNVLRTGSSTFVSGRDRRGPITVGAEVEFAVPVPAGGEPRNGRLVVYGNAEFANNFFIEYLGNKDLFVNTVAWLARDPDVMAHRGARQEPGRNQFYLTAEEGDRVFWAAAVLEPLLFALVGIVLVVRRRWSG
jgi:gliding motility-associatede transport system auxiliary component